MTKVTRNNRFQQAELLVDETIFSIANGYLGTRGTFCEGYGTSFEYHQSYLNGLYEYYDYHYEENLTGFPQQGQKIINLFDGTGIQFEIDGQLLNMSNATITDLSREYNLEKGYTIRTIQYEMGEYHFTVEERRLVSHDLRFVISQDVTLSSDDYVGSITIRSSLKSSHRQIIDSNDPRLHQGQEQAFDVVKLNQNDNQIILKTKRSNLHVCSTVIHSIKMISSVESEGLEWTTNATISTDHPVHLSKHTIHTTDIYGDDYIEQTNEIKQRLIAISLNRILELEAEEMARFWERTGVSIPNNKDLEQKLHYNMFQLYRQGGSHYIHNVAAKGLSGEGYEGHYFWDTEIYMMPFFTLTSPEKAKQLLLFRYHKLEASKQEAKNLGYDHGAKIPWRTINGDETSPYYPAGSAQFHINSDVAYSTIKYLQVTNDINFLINYGFELLVETARFLAEAVNDDGEQFHLNSVTGPDEYTTVVDDNCYTNMMLQYHFRKIVEYYDIYEKQLQDVIQKLGITNQEIAQFKDISKRINIPYDDNLGIYVQDNSFLQKKVLNLSSIPKENFPLLLHYHPLFLYKHQVLKQADTMLAMLLLDQFDQDTVRRSFEFYEPITTHDSSLSKCIYSILAFQLGLLEQAETDLKLVLDTDLNNVHHNTKDGLHVASMGGSYMGFLFGLVGLRLHQDYITLYPRVLEDIQTYKIQFMYHGHLVSIAVDDMVKITSTAPIKIKLYDEWIILQQSYESKTQLN